MQLGFFVHGQSLLVGQRHPDAISDQSAGISSRARAVVDRTCARCSSVRRRSPFAEPHQTGHTASQRHEPTRQVRQQQNPPPQRVPPLTAPSGAVSAVGCAPPTGPRRLRSWSSLTPSAARYPIFACPWRHRCAQDIPRPQARPRKVPQSVPEHIRPSRMNLALFSELGQRHNAVHELLRRESFRESGLAGRLVPVTSSSRPRRSGIRPSGRCAVESTRPSSKSNPLRWMAGRCSHGDTQELTPLSAFALESAW